MFLYYQYAFPSSQPRWKHRNFEHGSAVEECVYLLVMRPHLGHLQHFCTCTMNSDWFALLPSGQIQNKNFHSIIVNELTLVNYPLTSTIGMPVHSAIVLLTNKLKGFTCDMHGSVTQPLKFPPCYMDTEWLRQVYEKFCWYRLNNICFTLHVSWKHFFSSYSIFFLKIYIETYFGTCPPNKMEKVLFHSFNVKKSLIV